MSKSALLRLEEGRAGPYDASDHWWRESELLEPPPPVDWAHHAARGVICDILDRPFVRRAMARWEVKEDTRKETVKTLADIIRTAAEQTFLKELSVLQLRLKEWKVLYSQTEVLVDAVRFENILFRQVLLTIASGLAEDPQAVATSILAGLAMDPIPAELDLSKTGVSKRYADICPDCGRSIMKNRDGTFRVHYHPEGHECPGSWKKAPPFEEEEG